MFIESHVTSHTCQCSYYYVRHDAQHICDEPQNLGSLLQNVLSLKLNEVPCARVPTCCVKESHLRARATARVAAMKILTAASTVAARAVLKVGGPRLGRHNISAESSGSTLQPAGGAQPTQAPHFIREANVG